MPPSSKLLLLSNRMIVRYFAYWFVLIAPPLFAAWPALAQSSHGHAQAESVPLIGAFEQLARHAQVDAALGGRLLISELSCTACHFSDDRSLRSKGGPDLSAAGNRLSLTWMERFIVDPAATQPGTTMPNVLHAMPEQERQGAARALTAYLGSLRRPLPDIKATGTNPVPHQFWLRGDWDQGRTLFHRIGCVACHGPDSEYEVAQLPESPSKQLLELLEPEELAALGLAAAARTTPVQPLGELSDQYSLRSLTLFLLQPEATRPAGRMPNFKLSPIEAADIAAYLLRRDPQRQPQPDFVAQELAAASEPPAALVAHGRELFERLGCANCHRAGVEPGASVAPPLSQITVGTGLGCVARAGQEIEVKPKNVHPRFELDPVQFAALEQALEQQRRDDDPLANQPPAAGDQPLQLELLRFHCYACHERDGMGGIGRDRRGFFETVGNVDLGDEGRLPPPLTGVGRKALPAWLERVLQGNGRIRPYMHARMPQFPPAAAKEIATRLLRSDRAARDTSAAGGVHALIESHAAVAAWPDADDAKQVEVGRQMMDSGCVQCHMFGGEGLAGVVGVDLRGIGERVEPTWFREFLFNPGAVKQRTRMPNFFPDGKSQHSEWLGGDANRQIAAIWGYLTSLPHQPLPQTVQEARAKDFELVPSERPIVIRTFMHQAGTHAIAVGFPEQVHFAFDAQALRLAAAWRGRFLDAQGTWFIRSAPPADPLGEDQIGIESFTLFPSPDLPRRFLGYRLDSQGIPTFSYCVGDLIVVDRVTPLASAGSSGRPGLRRSLRLRLVPHQPGSEAELAVPAEIELLAGKQLTRLDEQSLQNEDGLLVTLSTPVESKWRDLDVVKVDGRSTWSLPLYLISDGTPEAVGGLRLGPAARGDAGAETFELELTYQW